MDYLLQLFKGVASQTRLKILQYLADNKEHKIEDIAQTLKVPFATCCRNLKILERIYLIESKRKKGYVFYKLHRPKEHIYNRLIMSLIDLRKSRIGKRISRNKDSRNNFTFAKK